MKTIASLNDFLTDAQIRKARRLMSDAKKIRDEVITPNMAGINQKLGQENDPMYLAYLVQYMLGRT